MIMLEEIIQVVVVLFIAVVFHEYAHGWMAYKRGDPTAKLMGRLTLNPLKHIDPVGMIVVPLALKLLGFKFVIGWAKPVPVDFSRLRNPKKDMIWVALAGPVTNFCLAFLLSQFLYLAPTAYFYETMSLAVILNLVIGLFNLIPIPPLDGSRLAMGMMPSSWAQKYARLEPYGFIILIVLLNIGFLDFIWFLALLMASVFRVNFLAL